MKKIKPSEFKEPLGIGDDNERFIENSIKEELLRLKMHLQNLEFLIAYKKKMKEDH